MKVVALAGGVGAGKFLRGLVRAAPDADLTAVVNTGDDIEALAPHVFGHRLELAPGISDVVPLLEKAWADPLERLSRSTLRWRGR